MSGSLAERLVETVAGTLYNHPAGHLLGEREDPSNPGQSEIWFRLSRHADRVPARQDPKQVVIRLHRAKGNVAALVEVSWLNLTGAEPIRGASAMQVATVGESPEAVFEAGVKMVERVFEIYTDVLSGRGVAGPLERTAPEPEATDAPDMARTDAEVGRDDDGEPEIIL
jgi:hypothetical protein